ncbi:MAG TPA: VTT domain-containing protein [Planctomycetota bacterium]|nr:VTT domain-containing protein [Planctomycetota bacterium]
MDLLHQFVDVVLHLDKHVVDLTAQYGTTTYAILAAIIFCETGLVVTPFLPGDSLLFAAGAVTAMGQLDPWALFGLLLLAAVSGDNLNYFIGRRIGQRAFENKLPLVKREHIERTQRFFAKRGPSTIVLARFVPIVRTFAPFVAGVGRMPYAKFLAYSLAGGAAWCGIFIAAGHFFGTLPVVKDNFSLVVLAIIGISLVPMAWQVLAARREERAARDERVA